MIYLLLFIKDQLSNKHIFLRVIKVYYTKHNYESDYISIFKKMTISLVMVFIYSICQLKKI